MNVSKALVAIAAAAALALAVGCGGESAATSTTSGTTQQGTATLAPQEKPGDGPSPEKRATTAEPPPSGSERGRASPTDPAPLPNEGTKVVAPAVPIAKGGDNSLQTFGLEAASGDRVEAAAVAKAYLDALAAGRWSLTCSMLAADARARFQALEKACPAGMRLLIASVPKAALRAGAEIDVISMRVQGSHAFLIYRNGEGTPSAIEMSHEDGSWKVAAISGTPLQL